MSRLARRWRRRVARHGAASASLLVLGLSSTVCAQEAAPGAGAKTPAAPDTAATAPAAVVRATPPPFWVAGVVIGPEKRSAVLVVLDERRRDVGLITLREGETYGGYRIAGVEPARVLLERDGTVFPLPVGRPSSGSATTAQPRPRGPIFIPGPDKPTPDLEYKGPQRERVGSGEAVGGSGGGDTPGTTGLAADPEATRDVLMKIFSSPMLQQQIEQNRPLMRQRLERDAQGQPRPPEIPPASRE